MGLDLDGWLVTACLTEAALVAVGVRRFNQWARLTIGVTE